LVFYLVKELENSELARKTLGEHIFNRFIDAKKIEIEEYQTEVHGWEIDKYLTKF
jgi:glutamine synthetase